MIVRNKIRQNVSGVTRFALSIRSAQLVIKSFIALLILNTRFTRMILILCLTFLRRLKTSFFKAAGLTAC